MSLLLKALKNAEEDKNSSEEKEESGIVSEQSPEGAVQPSEESAPAPAAVSATTDFDSLPDDSDSVAGSGQSPDSVATAGKQRKRVDAARVFGAGEEENVSGGVLRKVIMGLVGLAVVGGGGYGVVVSGVIPGFDVASVDSIVTGIIGEDGQVQPVASGSGIEEQLGQGEELFLPIPVVDVQSEVDFADLSLPQNSSNRLGNEGYREKVAVLTGWDIEDEITKKAEQELKLQSDLAAQRLEEAAAEAEADGAAIAAATELIVQTAENSRLYKADIDSRTPSDNVLAVAVGRSGDEAESGSEEADDAEQVVAQATQVVVAVSPEGAKRKAKLGNAKRLYYQGSYVEAESIYREILRETPASKNALRGLAVVAVATGRLQLAASIYLDMLNYYPNDPIAVTELINLRGSKNSDFYEVERVLKSLIGKAEGADDRIYFALGNLYAENARWSDAQNAYFEAFSRKSDNADYAYNLAVVLDYLNKLDLAFRYYEQAMVLSDDVPVSFDRVAVGARIEEIR